MTELSLSLEHSYYWPFWIFSKQLCLRLIYFCYKPKETNAEFTFEEKNCGEKIEFVCFFFQKITLINWIYTCVYIYIYIYIYREREREREREWERNLKLVSLWNDEIFIVVWTWGIIWPTIYIYIYIYICQCFYILFYSCVLLFFPVYNIYC